MWILNRLILVAPAVARIQGNAAKMKMLMLSSEKDPVIRFPRTARTCASMGPI